MCVWGGGGGGYWFSFFANFFDTISWGIYLAMVSAKLNIIKS